MIHMDCFKKDTKYHLISNYFKKKLSYFSPKGKQS